jgi:hypothetical protein
VHRRLGVVQGLDEDHGAHERGEQDGAGPENPSLNLGSKWAGLSVLGQNAVIGSADE